MDNSEEKEETTQCPWRVEEDDEARYNFSDQKGLWQPKPEDILSVFEQLAKGEVLPLKWTCPGRRPPESDTPDEDDDETQMEVEDDQFKEDYCDDPEPSTFDFDDSMSDTSSKVSPWRSHATMARTPKTEKRVARMDNIMDSLRKQQIQRAAEREARKTKLGTPTRVQQGRNRLNTFGSPAPKEAGPASLNAPVIVITSTLSSDSTSATAGNTSTSAISVSASVTAQSGEETASTSTSAQGHPGNAIMSLEEWDIKNAVDGENRKQDVQRRVDEIDSGYGESGTSITTTATLNTVTSPVPSFVTISSDSLSKSSTSGSVLPGLGYLSSEWTADTSNEQTSLMSTDPTVAASSRDIPATSVSQSASSPSPRPFTATLSSGSTTPSAFSAGTAVAGSATNVPCPSSTGPSLITLSSSGQRKNVAVDIAKTEGWVSSEPTAVVSSPSAKSSTAVTSDESSSFTTSSVSGVVPHSAQQTQSAIPVPDVSSFLSTAVCSTLVSTPAMASLAKMDPEG